jgi:hypothetical protein
VEHDLNMSVEDAASTAHPAAEVRAGEWTAPDAPADVGLAGLRAHLERLVARHGLRALTVVVDDPDVGRQAFRVGEGAIPSGLTASGPGVLTEPPLAPDALDADLLVALCAASLRVDVLRGGDATGGELALRRLPGVYAVAVERDDDLLLVRVDVTDEAPDDLGRLAARALAPEPGVRLVVELVRGEPATVRPQAPPASRAPADAASPSVASERGPQVLAVRSVPEDGEIEVHVALGASRAVGRAPLARGLAGAAEAVLAAIDQVAPGLRFVPAWARTVETTADGHFVVAVALVDPSGHDHRHGIAIGTSPIEAAARATGRSLD